MKTNDIRNFYLCFLIGFHDPFHHHHFGGLNDGHYAYEHHEHHFGTPIAQHYVAAPAIVHASPYIVQPGKFL